jgi:hemolysin III
VNLLKKPASAAVLPFYSISEEVTNSILHGLGALAATAGLVLLGLKTKGFLGGTALGSLDILAVYIFTATMLGMFLISTLYHAIPTGGAKRVLRKFDHSMIFIFIAGTYTPFCLIALHGPLGWSLLAVEWVFALTGITLNIFNLKILKKVEVAAYILMGWAVVIGFIPLVRSIPVVSIILLLSGGVAYTLGTLWYRRKDLKHTHAVWHAFVIIGTVCHWFSVWFMI